MHALVWPMSDTDDGFDEEAVREELREKYADEADDREATARMSDLLLQGATMTNQHCDRCGNPIFRYEGQSFCPQCQAPGQQADQQAGQQAGQQSARRSGEQAAAQGGQQSGESAVGQDDQPARQRASGGQRTASDARHTAEPPEPAPERASPPQPRHESDADLPAPQPGGESVDALESSIAALARRGASADDPRTAREYLEAAREAAEALAALRRNA